MPSRDVLSDGDEDAIGRPQVSPVADDEILLWFRPLSAHPRVLLAVSGGSDSTALAVLFARWRVLVGPDAPQGIVVTVDHGLRPEAAGEARVVAALAARLGLEHKTLTWRGAKPASGIQAAARAARYRLLAAFGREAGAGAVVTAHTLDDQAETFLLRLARGSGLAGLGAMRADRPLEGGVALLRPLLAAPRARLRATLLAAGESWSDDPSNENAAFARVRLRRLMPLLAGEGLGAARLAETARRLQRAQDAIDGMTATLLEAPAAALRLPELAALDLGPLLAAHEEVRLRALSRLIVAIGGAPYGPRIAALEGACAALLAGEDVARRTLGGVVLSRRRGWLWLWREAGRSGLPALRLAPGESALWDGRVPVSLSAQAESVVEIAALGAGVAGGIGLAPSLPGAGQVPAAAMAALMAVRAGGRVVAVPALGWQAEDAAGLLPQAGRRQ